MNQQERSEMRGKHTSITFQPADYPQHPVCIVCDSAYPCDVIKVLDAWEEWLNSRTQTDTTEYPPEGQNVECDAWEAWEAWEAEVHDGSELSTTREVCDHLKSVATVEDDGAMCWYVFGYCPHCGERLDPTEQDLYRVANWSGTTDTGIPYVEKLTPTGTTLSNENGNL